MTGFSNTELNDKNFFQLETAIEDLYKYLYDVMYNPHAAFLDIQKLPDNLKVFCTGFQYFVDCVMETKILAQSLANGDLNVKIPSRGNEIAAPLKALHASLRHLTWQIQQVAKGDYTQRVAFMGEFSEAFNLMVDQLAERQKILECKINQMQINELSLEKNNLLLSKLMQHVQQQIFVIDIDTNEIILMNDIARIEVDNDAEYMKKILHLFSGSNVQENSCEKEILYTHGEIERYFSVKTYYMEWHNYNAAVYTVTDITSAKRKIKELEKHAYRDSITQLYNRTFGMLTLDRWLYERKCFSLIFADLDGLKYINDEFGHGEGDIYIMNSAKHLKTFSPSAVVCRIGGDEFMLLVPDISHDEAQSVMDKIYENCSNDDYLSDKTYFYSLSFGIVEVDAANNQSAGDILSIADSRMYENKRMRKKTRKNNKYLTVQAELS